MSDAPPPRRPRPPDPFLGAAMMAVGALITALFGSCTVMTLDNGHAGQAWALALVWAVVAFGGLALIRAGWRTLRGDRDRSAGAEPGQER